MDLPLNNSAGDLRLAERGVAVYGTVAEWQGQFLTLSKAACHYIEDSVARSCHFATPFIPIP